MATAPKFRLRKESGELIEIPEDVVFLEIVHPDGSVGQVFTRCENGQLMIIDASTQKHAQAYSRVFRVDFTPVRDVALRSP